MITTLIFDFGGVLINLDRQRCIDAFEQLGLHDIGRLIDNYAQAGIFAQLENGDITTDEFHDGVRQIVGKPIDEKYDEEYKDIWREAVNDPELPILYNVNFGHATPRAILPYGAAARADANKQEIVLL